MKKPPYFNSASPKHDSFHFPFPDKQRELK